MSNDELCRSLALGHANPSMACRECSQIPYPTSSETPSSIVGSPRKVGGASPPAYDVTYAYNPNGLWTGSHQMAVNGKRDGIDLDDMLAAARRMSIKGARSKDIIAQVGDAVRCWNEFADEAKLAEEVAKKIEATFVEI